MMGRAGRRTAPNLDQPGPVETIKAGPQAGPVGAELADLDPVAFARVRRQQERSAHAVETVAGRAEEAELPLGAIQGAATRPDQPGREAEAQRPRIRQAAVNAVVDVQRVAAAKLHLNHYRGASGDQGPARLGP